MEALKGKSVVITGASSGIGAEIARDLGRHGVHLTLGARRVERMKDLAEEIRESGGKAEVCATDVTSREQVEGLVAAAEKAFGRVDVLVNNAGLMPLSLMEKLHIDEWERMIDVNIKGVLYGVAAVLPRMLKQGGGQIINVSSVAGHHVFAGAGVYCATKFAVRALSEGLRRELAGRVRVTNISPGAIATELAESITDEDVRKGIAPVLDIAVGPDAIARAVRYAIEQPADVSVNEMIIRPTAQEL